MRIHVNGQVSALSVSGFPLACLNSCIPSSNNSPHREPMRPPGFSDVSLPACHGLMTPTDLLTQAITGDLVLPSVCPKTLGIRLSNPISKLYQHFREHGLPYGLQDSLSTLRPYCSSSLDDSAMDARLDTGGWPTLTRRGLSPRKIRRAFPGALGNWIFHHPVLCVQNGPIVPIRLQFQPETDHIS